MSGKPAIMEATYVDAKFMPGLKVMRISLDLPIERSNEFLKLFGAPDRANPVWCAVARLQPVAEPLAEGAQAPATPEKKRSNIAAIKCKEDEAFQIWLAEKYPNTWDRFYLQNPISSEAADSTLKEVLCIQSRKELDVPGPAAEAFDRLICSFDNRNYTR